MNILTLKLQKALELLKQHFYKYSIALFKIIKRSDDVHVPDDLYGGWIWVKAVERSKSAILDALRHGFYYSSSGPTIYDFGMEEDQVYVSCSACREIHFVTYPPRGKSFFAEQGKSLMDASHKLTGRESYVRVVCVDENGRSAWTNPIFFN